MPRQLHVGLAIWPRKSAQWLELGLKTSPDLRVSVLSNESAESGSEWDLLVIDGDNPGPNFITYYASYLKLFSHCDLVVLGSPGCPALLTIDWDPNRTVFIAKPYLIEDALKTIHARLGEIVLRESASPVASSPAPSPPAPPSPSVAEAASGRAKSLGYLSTLKLADLIQMLCLNNWTGRIDVKNLATNEAGHVAIVDGMVQDAAQGNARGEHACYLMLSWGRCQFEFTEDVTPAQITVQSHWQSLLLEGARLLDEGFLKS